MKTDRWGNRVIEPHERQRYRDMTVQQIINWHNGIKHHHPMTGECCPDFSCCYPDMYEQDPDKRVRTMRRAIERARS